MSKIVENVRVTIPDKDIQDKHADVVREASKRFSIWWSVTQPYRTSPAEIQI